MLKRTDRRRQQEKLSKEETVLRLAIVAAIFDLVHKLIDFLEKLLGC